MQLQPENIPLCLSERDQWVLWREESRDGDSKPTKIPYDAKTGRRASSTDSATWATFRQAVVAYQAGGYSGIGFVFAGDDPFVGIDLDDSLDSAGNLKPWAAELFNPCLTYGEVSPSGRGVKFFARGQLAGAGTNRKGFGPDATGGVEMYERGRFFTVTGNRYHECPPDVLDCSTQGLDLYARIKANNLPAYNPNRPTAPTIDAAERCRRYLEKVPDAISGKGGHNATFRAACECFRFGLTTSQAWDALNWFNGTKCQPPWTEAELRHKLQQGQKAVDQEGRFAARLQADGEAADWPTPFASASSSVSISQAVDDVIRPMLRPFSDIDAKPINWLWPERIGLGKLSLLCGDPGLGKSFVTLDMAARVSTGTAWPDGTPCPLGSAIIISAEDDPADTIRPRLDRAGADVRKVIEMPGLIVPGKGGKMIERALTLEDLPQLAQALDQYPDCRLMVIDPVSAYLSDADGHANAEIRALLAPLARLAADRAVAMLLVTHLSKAGGRAMYRAMGSMAFVAACRSSWVVAKDREDGRRRLMLPVKNNIGNDESGLAYSLVDGKVEWESEPVTTKADDALNDDAGDGMPGPDPDQREEAKAFLRKALGQTARPANDVYRMAREAGISKRTLDRAKKEVGITSRPAGMTGGRWVWELPSVAADALIQGAAA